MSLPGGIDAGGRRRRGATLLLVVGAVALAGGIGVLAYAIGMAAGSAGAIGEDAVAEGTLSPESAARAIPFESTERDLTVYLRFGGVFSNTDTQESAASATSCQVVSGGLKKTFDGSRQGTSATIGDYTSVGSFTLPQSSGRITCRYERFSAAQPSEVPFVVTPHGTDEVTRSVLLIFAGVGIGILGGWAAVAGWLRRRSNARLAGLA